jgi:hypothetical protein
MVLLRQRKWKIGTLKTNYSKYRKDIGQFNKEKDKHNRLVLISKPVLSGNTSFR